MTPRTHETALPPATTHFELQEDKLRLLRWLALCTIHDLNNYLTAIMGAASMASDRGGAIVQKELDMVDLACQRGREALQGLRDFCQDRTTPNQVVDLNRLARDAGKFITPVAPGKVGLLLDLASEATPISGDKAALQSVLFNVLINSLDAMPKGGTITLRTRNEANDRVSLTVQDTGEGMSTDALAHATEAFFTTKPVGKGQGIGLASVRETIKAHQGSLSISSEKGLGTRVRFEFDRVALD
jgi:signal transduction histidine kinase